MKAIPRGNSSVNWFLPVTQNCPWSFQLAHEPIFQSSGMISRSTPDLISSLKASESITACVPCSRICQQKWRKNAKWLSIRYISLHTLSESYGWKWSSVLPNHHLVTPLNQANGLCAKVVLILFFARFKVVTHILAIYGPSSCISETVSTRQPQLIQKSQTNSVQFSPHCGLEVHPTFLAKSEALIWRFSMLPRQHIDFGRPVENKTHKFNIRFWQNPKS